MTATRGPDSSHLAESASRTYAALAEVRGVEEAGDNASRYAVQQNFIQGPLCSSLLMMLAIVSASRDGKLTPR